MRVEGSDYIVQDGDIFYFRFNRLGADEMSANF